MAEPSPEEPPSPCCAPHVFTSALLGVLACVLMTGGVFLSFHRWDPLWLIVSGVGVVLVLIGSILHCCRSKRPVVGKGCCLPDHLHNHVVINSGSLTEQLLPLSNARSVSQLSLNMLPGYFPPVVTTYGIEQHSTVVQNINRIIQQQTQNPGVTENLGKNFFLLSLPGNTSQANIQNLVATVYQLEGSVLAGASNTTDVSAPAAPVSMATTASVQNPIPILKNAEVQTCSVWPVICSSNVPANSLPSTSGALNVRNSAPISTQTEELEPHVSINLMDCQPNSICDISFQNASTDIDIPIPAVLVNVFDETRSDVHPETNQNSLMCSTTNCVLEIPPVPPPISSFPSSTQVSSDILIDITGSPPESSSLETTSLNVPTISSLPNNELDQTMTPTNEISNNNNVDDTSTNIAAVDSNSCADSTIISSNRTIVPNGTDNFAIASTSATQETSDTVFCDNPSDDSLSIADAEDSESSGRFSPPPSYEDVALQNENPVGVFGLAYGTL